MFGRILRRLVRRPTGPELPPATLGSSLGVPAPDQTRDLVLYKFDACPFCQVALDVLERHGLDIPMRDTRRDPDARSEHRARSGQTQVPCLYIDGTPLFESSDIARWLEAYAANADA